MAETARPTRVYQHHHFDSTRWQAVPPREGDIVIATSVKSGTTWMQAIVANLLFPGESFPAPPRMMSPWVDFRAAPLEEIVARLEAQTHRRFLKTHLPFEALPERPGTRWIYVCRDGRDVAVSLWHHYRGYTEESFARYNDWPGRVGPPLPRPPAEFLTFWRSWCTRGWFDWEGDGWPFWSHLHVAQSWWDARHRPDVLLMHYAAMKRDPASAVEQVAAHLGIPLTPDRRDAVVAASSLGNMRAKGNDYVPNGGASWSGGVEGFLRAGENRQWEGLVPPADLALYDAACDRALSPDCRGWMETGGAA